MDLVKCLENPMHDRKSILIVDDDIDLLIAHQTLLEISGYKVRVAQSGAAALKILEEIDTPDLILLDVQMEDMNGHEFLKLLERKIPKVTSTVPVVFLSATEQIPPREAAGFILKPTDMGEFLQAVQRYIELGSHSPYRTPA